MTVTLNRSSSTRIEGLDLARAIALLGMIVVHFDLVVAGGGTSPEWLATLTGALQGRAAATFVVLAGIGGSLGSRRARESGDPALRRRSRVALLKRGLFLMAVGCLFLPVWPADILHSYGLWLSCGALLLFAPAGALVVATLASIAGGSAFLLTGQFFDHWNLADLSYRGLWTPVGFVRNLFLDGWNPFFPWFGLYTLGLLLGRLDLRDRSVRRRLFFAGVVAAMATGAASAMWADALTSVPRPGHLLMTSATPPTPAFVLYAGGLALAVITTSITVAERWARAVAPLVAAGQLALTLYIAHVLIGLGVLESMGYLGGQSLPFAVGAALVFFAVAAAAAWGWRKRFSRGPLEALMRAVS